LVASRSRLLRPVAAALATLALAACTAGVPPTGEVTTVSPVAAPTPRVDAQTVEDASEPSSGLSEQEVAVGFMYAMNTGRLDKIARWVLPKARDQVQGWSERTTVKVYSDFQPELPVVRDDKRVVPINIKQVGQLEAGRDWVPVTGDDTLNLVLGRDGGDARVADPGDVLWMSDISFNKLYVPVDLFMVPDLADPTPRLAPVPVFVRRATKREEAPAERVRNALEQLLAGPQGRYDNLSTAIPSKTSLLDFQYAGEVATVDLSREFTYPGAGPGQLRVGQIVWTVSRLLQTTEIRILVEGRPVGPLGRDRFPAGRPWRRTDAQLSSLWPQRSRVGDGNSVLFVRGGEIYTIPPRPGESPKVVGLTAVVPKSAPTWSPDHRWMAFLAGNGGSQGLWLAQPGGRAFPVPSRVSGSLSPPSWSPDSQKIYLLSRGQRGARLWQVTRDLEVTQLELPELRQGLQPTTISVSPDGSFVLALAQRVDAEGNSADPGDGGQLFLGQLGRDGVIGWSERQMAPGVGRIFSPVWVDALTVAFIAETDNKDDLGKLWIMRSDGWNPTAVVNNDADGVPIADIGNQLTVDPAGDNFVVTVRSKNGDSLWMVDRLGNIRPLTLPSANGFDADPSFASR
jgi:sporulation and spore germination protein/WD40 repeat protein